MNARTPLVDQQVSELARVFRNTDEKGRTFILKLAVLQAERWPAHPKPMLTLVHSLPAIPALTKDSK